MRQPGILRSIAFGAFALLISAPGRAQKTVSITSMPAPDTAVVSAGADAGLGVGQELPIFRDGQRIGTLVLTGVDNQTATGRVAAVAGAGVRVLDLVQLPNAPAQPPAKAPVPVRPPKPTKPAVVPAYNEHDGDIIPWERWEYMALSSLAVDGLLPGYAARDFQATRQFTRGQLADLTAKALLLYMSGLGTDRDQMLLRRLAQDFALEPAVKEASDAAKEIKLDRTPKAPAVGSAPGLSVYGGVRLWRFRSDEHESITGRVGGIYDLNDNAFLALSVNNLHRLTSALPSAFPAVDVATLNFHGLGLDWEIGKTYWSSGPAYSGDGLLSDNSPGMLMAKARGAFNWGKLGRFVGTEVYGGFQDNLEHKYYGLRRMETRLTPKLELGLGESYIATHAPNPASLVLPYYAYQRLFVLHQNIGTHGDSTTGNETFNYMAQVDLTAHLSRKAPTYFEYILDDISAPSSLGEGNVPRKTGFVFGMHFPTLFGSRGEGRFEIYNADRETYLGIQPQVGWSNHDLLIGNPFGPNTQAFFGRLDYRFTNRVKGSLQLRDAVQYHNGLPDMGDRFELALTTAYDITPAESVSVSYVPQRFRGQGYTERPTALNVMGTYAY